MNPICTLFIRFAFIAFGVGMVCLTLGLGYHYTGPSRGVFWVLGFIGTVICVFGAYVAHGWRD
jgi:hypothetical protein